MLSFFSSSLVYNSLQRHLDKAESLPPGMARVEETETPDGIPGSFFIDKYEVTNRQFKQFADAGGYRNKGYWKHKFIKVGHELTWEEAMKEFVDITDQPGPSTWQAGVYPEREGDYPVSGIWKPVRISTAAGLPIILSNFGRAVLSATGMRLTARLAYS